MASVAFDAPHFPLQGVKTVLMDTSHFSGATENGCLRTAATGPLTTQVGRSAARGGTHAAVARRYYNGTEDELGMKVFVGPTEGDTYWFCSFQK